MTAQVRSAGVVHGQQPDYRHQRAIYRIRKELNIPDDELADDVLLSTELHTLPITDKTASRMYLWSCNPSLSEPLKSMTPNELSVSFAIS